MSRPSLGIGIVGAGTVGAGVIELLTERAALLQERAGIALEIARAADIDQSRLQALGLPKDRISSRADAVIADPNVDLVIELIGGTDAAYDLVAAGLKAGKPIVSANKALLAERGQGLFQLAAEQQVPLRFEAAVCGAIPIIRALRDGLVADRIERLLGIVNGTCNYVLTRMYEQGQNYAEALAEAQRHGYAEADPTFDVEGYDSAHKLTLLSALAFDTQVPYRDVRVEGISHLAPQDVAIAAEMDYVVKLLAVARPVEDRLFLSVHPSLLPTGHPLANVSGTMNAVALHSDAAGEAMYYGRGAGALPTASAVLSDVVEIARAKASGRPPAPWVPKAAHRYALAAGEDYICRYYLRATVVDRFGVLGAIATILGHHKVSIASVVQKDVVRSSAEEDSVPIVILTHAAREGDLRGALAEVDRLDVVTEPTAVLRIEE